MDGGFPLCFFHVALRMNEAETLFVALRQSADDGVVNALERIVRDAPDSCLEQDKCA